VSATLRRRDQVNVTFRYGLAALDGPCESPIDDLIVARDAAGIRFGRQQFGTADRLQEILFETTRVTPLEFFLRLLDLEAHGQARAQHGLGPQCMFQSRYRELRGIEVLRIRPEADGGSGIRLAYSAYLLELAAFLATGKTHVVFLAAAAYPHLQVL
jgi:hypothetical protein